MALASLTFVLALLSCASPSLAAVRKTTKAPAASSSSSGSSKCTPFTENFGSLSNWKVITDNRATVKQVSGGGVQMVLQPPKGKVKTDGVTNNVLGDGPTLNSTAAFQYGRLTITMAGSTVPGVVTAGILIGATEWLRAGEVDLELLGGDPTHFQTNIFQVNKGEKGPLYGVFGKTSGYASGGTVGQTHAYTIDWSPSSLSWSVDGKTVRTITPKQTLKNGYTHYPSGMMRVQLGIWDASSPRGTSKWAKGPINWAKQSKSAISATVKSVKLECPY